MSTDIKKFTIDHDVPMPKGRSLVYPFDKMKIGDSFLFDDTRETSVRSAASLFAKKQTPEWKFTVRRVDRDEYRCWRIA